MAIGWKHLRRSPDSMLRLVFVAYLALCCAGDDLLDIVGGALNYATRGPQEVRAAVRTDDDSDDHHSASSIEHGVLAAPADLVQLRLSEFSALALSPPVASRPQPLSLGRAPPSNLS